LGNGIRLLEAYAIPIWSLHGVVKKHDFCSIQQKIPQISDFPKKRDSNPLPHGDNAVDIAKMFVNFFSKNWFSGRKTRFSQKNPISTKFHKAFHENRIP
jgi:hypothetical protein